METLENAFKNAITNAEHAAEMEKLGLKTDFIGSADYTALIKEQEQTLLGMADIMGWDL